MGRQLSTDSYHDTELANRVASGWACFFKLKDNEESGARKKHRETAANMLANDRFWAMFTDENLQVDQNDLTFKLLNPVLTKLDNKKVSFGRW